MTHTIGLLITVMIVVFMTTFTVKISKKYRFDKCPKCGSKRIKYLGAVPQNDDYFVCEDCGTYYVQHGDGSVQEMNRDNR